MNKKIFGFLAAVLLVMALVPMASAETEAVDMQITAIGGKNLTFWEGMFSYLWILGVCDIQLGEAVASWGNPPTLSGVTTTFEKGEHVEMLFIARNVEGGSTIYFDFCEGGAGAEEICPPAHIFYEPDEGYVDYVRVDGNWDLWWVIGAFTAEKGATLRAMDYVFPGDVLATKSFTVTSIATPTPTPDPCLGITCSDKCVGNTRHFNGYCSGGNCYYSTQNCPFGCSWGACNADPCQGVTCSNFCSGNTLFYNGYCSGGDCQYSQRNCDYGCYGGACNAAPTVTPTPTVTPSPTPTSTPVPTPTPTTTPNGTPTATPTGTPDPYKPIIPGFEAVFAILGILTVAYFVLRRKNGEI